MGASDLDERSLLIRRNIVDMMRKAKRGHPASAFSLVEILRVLYDDILVYDAKNPSSLSRDRCILSKGHGCMALYVLLAEKGFFPKSELDTFCSFDALLGGHPEISIPGVETSTGSLGHGLSIGLGMALDAKRSHKNHKVYVIIGDGESNEGSIWEAALSACKNKVDNLVLIIDYNKYQSYGFTKDVLDLEPYAKKWESFGFSVKEVDGHNVSEIKTALSVLPFSKNKPSVLICHTVKGKGVSFMESNSKYHHPRLSDDDYNLIFSELGGNK